VRHTFAALDLASGQLFHRLRDRKHSQEFLEFLRQLRRRFPTGRLHVVCDNFSPHRKATVLAWCTGHDIELVFTPTQASWLNWIESEFTALRYFTLDGSDYPSHTARSRHRRLHPLGQPARHTQATLRPRIQDPQTRLPTERCLTRH
jgi:transposase